MFDIFKKNKKCEKKINNTENETDFDPIETFMNNSEDKCGELYYKNGCYTFIIMEKFFDDYEGNIHCYWHPAQTSASFYDTREKAVEEIMSVIEPKECI